jgi:hypothetical protein
VISSNLYGELLPGAALEKGTDIKDVSNTLLIRLIKFYSGKQKELP